MNHESRPITPSTDSSEFDSLLDHAIASYLPVEPRTGLERRILNAVAAEIIPSSPHRNWASLRPWRIAAFSTLAMAALILGIWFHFHHPSAPQQSAHYGSNLPSKPSRVSETSVKPKIVSTSFARAHKHPGVPLIPERKIDPTKLTPNEELLARLVAHRPYQARAIATNQANIDSPIAIPALDANPIGISPLFTQPIIVVPIQIASGDQPPSASPTR